MFFRVHPGRVLLVVFLIFLAFEHRFAQTGKPNFNRTRTFDVQHYQIRTDFDRKNKTIYGQTVVFLKPLKNGFNKFELDTAHLNFESVVLEPEGIELKYRTEDEKVIVSLSKNYSPKDLIKVRFKYTAKPKKGVYFIGDERNGEKIVRDAQIWTQGEPEESRHWFPSYDFPDDKATTEQFLTVERDEIAISNGELLETISNPDGTKTLHFRMNFPHSVYLTSFVIGKYVKISDSYKKIPLGIYLYPGREYLVENAFGKTKEMLRIYEELTGIEFPFNKYDQTIVAKFNFGGMENITATTLSDSEIFFSQTRRDEVEDIVSHEISHSWFGNLVTCRNWAELWLNESFATFMEAAYREKMYGRDDYLRKIRSDVYEYFAGEIKIRKKRGLFNQSARPDDSIFDVITYQKGSAVIHTLRELIGDKAFWKAIHIYLQRHRLRNVETADLQSVFEETSKKDLAWFFRQWVFAAGFPKLEVEPRYDRQTKILTLHIEQTQKDEDLTPAVFILPLEIEITTSSGTRKENITIRKRAENFAFRLEEPPTGIIFDKAEKIPLKTVRIQNPEENN